MSETTTTSKPLWVKILFETPEFIAESLFRGMFPKSRKKIIDISTEILVYFGKRRTKITNKFRWVERITLHIIEWINNNWNKKLNN